MTIYLVKHVDDEFRWLGPLTTDKEAQRQLGRVRFDAVKDCWIPVEVCWLRETADRHVCDFPTFWVGIFALSQRAKAELGELLGPAGEFLPLKGLSDQYVGYHCLKTIDAVDDVQTRKALDLAPIRSFASPTFIPVLRSGAVEHVDVFRVPQSFGKLFVSRRFKDAYDRARLTGLEFSAVTLT